MDERSSTVIRTSRRAGVAVALAALAALALVPPPAVSRRNRCSPT